MSQCLSTPDLDLDTAPPRRRQYQAGQQPGNLPDYGTAQGASAPPPVASAPPRSLHVSIPAERDEDEDEGSDPYYSGGTQPDPPPNTKGSKSSTRTAYQTRSQRGEVDFQAPMVEVAGQDGPILVQRFWTTKDILETTKSLPHFSENFGT